MNQPIVIVGASHAGVELGLHLRQLEYSGDIQIVGDEPHLPYHRPPLSKAFLSSAATAPAPLRPAATYAAAHIELIQGVRVESIDRASHTLRLSDRRELPYEKLALATGARVRQLPCAADVPAGSVHYLRSANDACALRAQMRTGARLVVIGGGYVGLEVAAAAVKCGLAVTVLEAQHRVLARVTGEVMSTFYEAVHRAAGVVVHTGVSCAEIRPHASGSGAVTLHCQHTLSDASFEIDADVVVVGIGIVPDCDLAVRAGLTVADGIVVDRQARTSDPAIVAAGDCTRQPSDADTRGMRLESVQNAVDQARIAAATLCGQERVYRPVPWFWSDQYDLKLQMAGLSAGHDEVVVRGIPETRSFAAFYLQQGRLIAADVVNRPKEFMISRRLLEAGVHPPPAALQDESIDLLECARQYGKRVLTP